MNFKAVDQFFLFYFSFFFGRNFCGLFAPCCCWLFWTVTVQWNYKSVVTWGRLGLLQSWPSSDHQKMMKKEAPEEEEEDDVHMRQRRSSSVGGDYYSVISAAAGHLMMNSGAGGAVAGPSVVQQSLPPPPPPYRIIQYNQQQQQQASATGRRFWICWRASIFPHLVDLISIKKEIIAPPFCFLTSFCKNSHFALFNLNVEIVI